MIEIKKLSSFIKESFDSYKEEIEKQLNESEESIKSEEDFKDYAKNKFKEVFGEEIDEDKMNEVIEGIIKKCDGDWGEAVGMLNKSFGS